MTAMDLIARVAAVRDVTILQIKGRDRTKHIASARHEAAWMLREATEMSLPEIGRVLGGRDHTSVLWAVGKIQARVDADPGYRTELRNIASMSVVEQRDALVAECNVLAMELAQRRMLLRQMARRVPRAGVAQRAA